MPLHIIKQPPEKPETRGGLSIIGSLLSAIGMATGQPWLAIPGAAMTMIDTPSGQRNPAQFISTLSNVISTTKTAQMGKANRTYIENLANLNPADWEDYTMDLPIGLDRAPLGGRGGPPVPSSYSIPEQKKGGLFGLFRDGPVSSIKEQMQLGIIEQKMGQQMGLSEPDTLADMRRKYAETLDPGTPEHQRALGIPVPTGKSKGDVLGLLDMGRLDDVVEMILGKRVDKLKGEKYGEYSESEVQALYDNYKAYAGYEDLPDKMKKQFDTAFWSEIKARNKLGAKYRIPKKKPKPPPRYAGILDTPQERKIKEALRDGKITEKEYQTIQETLSTNPEKIDEILERIRGF